MKSLRFSAQKAGVTDSPLRVRAAGQRAGMTPPFSVTQLVNRWENPPLEEAKFRQAIITGGLAALGGFVELTLRNDGTYRILFHLTNNKGLVDYKFQVRALFAAANGLMFGWQNSGKVEGTESTRLGHEPRRTSDAEIKGSHPLIKQNWAALKAGKFAVTKEYSATGVAGFIDDVVKTVASATAEATRNIGGVVIGLGDEMVSAINSVNVDLGIIAGAVVFAAGGGLALATVTGTQFGAVTAALVHSRQVRPDEYQFAARVFGGSLPPIENLWLTNLESFGGRAITLPAPRGGGRIYLNVGAYCMDHPLTHVQKNSPVPGQLFIHELTHAWQIYHRRSLLSWLAEGAYLQAENSLVKSVYRYGPAGLTWGEYNLEQQASIVDDWFAGTREVDTNGNPKLPAMDPMSDYFRYIRDNIQQSRT